ncbi:IDEAL domain-containing protein [Paenibacillus borealis]|uniref:IDEAL domain-containing protein n=1 Tax=Paenibacillus borealis TaxID=160799 RepID=A0A089LDX1_PAEBO|nr:IDEAL domain-containing protein [Paenibacillus borealis]AIQ59711.1 hypothetical protein PBOR_24220 [Paenibacillus borealis]
MFIDFGMLMQLRYEAMLSVHADAIWQASIQRFNEERLLKLIDQALDDQNPEAFYQYSAELAGVRAVQAYGQVTSASKG